MKAMRDSWRLPGTHLPPVTSLCRHDCCRQLKFLPSQHHVWILLHIAGGTVAITVGPIPIYRLAARYLSLVHRAMSYLSAVFLAGCAGLWAFARHAAVRRAWVKRSHGYRYFSVGAQPVFAGLQRPLVSEFIQKLIDENSLVGSRLMKLWRVGQLPMRNPRMQAVDTESKITATRPFRPIIWKMNGGSLMLSEIAHPPNSYPG
jgi:hypothetical protein